LNVERVLQEACNAAAAKSVYEMAVGMVRFVMATTSSNLKKTIQKLCHNMCAVHGELLRLAALPEMLKFLEVIEKEELTADVWKDLLENSSGETGRRFHVFFKQWRKLKDGLADVTQNIGQVSAAGELNESVSSSLKAAASKVDGEKQKILNLIGTLSAVQALCRPLAPGETRAMLVKRVRAGLQKDQMNVAAPLSIALQAAQAV
jgi:uncharacterized protein YukE